MFVDLLKNKSQPENAADGVVEWVEKERQMKERLKKEKEVREQREKAVVRFPHILSSAPYIIY